MTTFHERYTDNFTVNIPEMLMHARAIGTGLLSLLLSWPGYEANNILAWPQIIPLAKMILLSSINMFVWEDIMSQGIIYESHHRMINFYSPQKYTSGNFFSFFF